MTFTKILPVVLIAALTMACGYESSEPKPKTDGDTPSAENVAVTEKIAVKKYSAALQKAKDTGRNIVVFYGSDSCPWSKQMDEQALANGDVQAALRDVVYLRVIQGVNAEEFEAKWGKQTTPTIVTLDADGKPLGRKLSGVVKTADFLSYVGWAKTGEGPQPGIATGGG